MKTTYIVQGFNWQETGKDTRLMGYLPFLFKTEKKARNKALTLSVSRKYIGVITTSQERNEDTGEYGEVKILVRYGELPSELEED